MKYKFLLPVFLLLILPFAAAEKGVGIVWTVQSEIVKENEVHCVDYSVYNPFTEDANIYLTAGGNLSSFVTDSDAKLVPAGTGHNEAIPISVCFKIPKVYKDDCIAGTLCEQTCKASEVSFVGEVIAAEKTTSTTTAATGSSTQAAASVPLTLKVSCEPKERNWMPVFVIFVVLIALWVVFVVVKKGRKKT